MKLILYYLSIFIGGFLLLNNSVFGLVYFKILGLILVMFPVYKLQSKTPSKSDSNDSLNSNSDHEKL